MIKKSNTKINDLVYSDSEKVESIIILVMPLDSEIKTIDTVVLMSNILKDSGFKCEIIGTSMASRLRGIKKSMFLSSSIKESIPSIISQKLNLVWKKYKPHFIIIEGDGGILNPKFPGSHELLTCVKPDLILFHHDPKRTKYLGTINTSVHSFKKQIKIIELISGKRICALVYNSDTENPAANFSNIIFTELDIPCYSTSVSSLKKLVQYLLKISGRLSFSKSRFQRRNISA